MKKENTIYQGERYKTTTNANLNKKFTKAEPFQEKGIPDTETDYAFWSKILKKPFDSIKSLKEAESAYYAELKAKEDKAATKRNDAKKVEDAFKALNTARKEYKDDLVKITETYSNNLMDLKKAFEQSKEGIKTKLAMAEDTYAKALKAFTDKYPEGYHFTLKDGDFETTISGGRVCEKPTSANKADSLFDLFDMFFRF